MSRPDFQRLCRIVCDYISFPYKIIYMYLETPDPIPSRAVISVSWRYFGICDNTEAKMSPKIYSTN